MKIKLILFLALLTTLTACSASMVSMKEKQQKELGILEYELRKAVLIEAIAKTKQVSNTQSE